jgi:GNAT superfamily N-acetyltransferase
MSQTNPQLTESLHQFVTIWKLLGRGFPEVDQTDKSGLAITWPDTQFPFYNALFLPEPLVDVQELQQRVQAAAAYMRARSTGGLFLICLDNVSGAAKEALPRVVAEAKFVEAIPMSGMAGNIFPLAAPGHPKLRFERILDVTGIRDFAWLNCISYDVPVDTISSLLNEHTLWRQHAYGYVAYENDKPVSTATAIVNEGCLFLFLVATAPEVRRKGYGEAVVRHALQTAYEATGIKRTVLHATQAGYPLYLRLGYHDTVKFMGYMLETSNQ